MTEFDYRTKIAALLAKAEDPATTPEEAESYSAAAEKLMIKWGITDAMAREAQAGMTAAEEIITTMIRIDDRYNVTILDLGNCIAQGLGSVRTMQTKINRGAAILWFVGHESDVARVITLWESLKVQAQQALWAWWRTVPFKGTYSSPQRFQARRQFLLSFSHAVYDRLYKERKAEVDATSGAELVLVSRGDRVENYMRDQFKTRTHKARLKGSNLGQREGWDAGQKASFDKSKMIGE